MLSLLFQSKQIHMLLSIMGIANAHLILVGGGKHVLPQAKHATGLIVRESSGVQVPVECISRERSLNLILHSKQT